MNNTPYAYQSPVLAQKLLLESINSSKQNRAACDTMVANPCNDTMSNISTTPSFQAIRALSPRTDYGAPIEQIRELFSRTARRAYEHELISERGQQTIAKAKQYNIPFDQDNIDWLALMDEIEEYEFLLTKAEELELDWDYRYYDPNGLEDAIEAYEHDEYVAQRTICRDFYATR